MVGTTILIVLCALLLTACIVLAEALMKRVPGKPTQTFWEALKPAPPIEPPKDYAPASIPRGRTSWRKQMVQLQVQHNSKQKERDAMFPKEIPNGKTR